MFKVSGQPLRLTWELQLPTLKEIEMTATYTMTRTGSAYAVKRATATATLAEVKAVKAAQRIAGDAMVVAELERYDSFEGSKRDALEVMASRSTWAASTIKQRITDARVVLDFFGCTADELIATIGTGETVLIGGKEAPTSLQGMKAAIKAAELAGADDMEEAGTEEAGTEEAGTVAASVDAADMLLKLAADMGTIRQAVVDGQFASDESLRDAVIAMEVERETLTLALNHALRKLNRVR